MIEQIEAQLRDAVIIENNGRSDVIGLGSVVTVLEEGGAEKETYTIVGFAEADPLNGLISNESPIGGALLGKKKGDKVTVETPGGQITLKVVKIS